MQEDKSEKSLLKKMKHQQIQKDSTYQITVNNKITAITGFRVTESEFTLKQVWVAKCNFLGRYCCTQRPEATPCKAQRETKEGFCLSQLPHKKEKEGEFV